MAANALLSPKAARQQAANVARYTVAFEVMLIGFDQQPASLRRYLG
jgi:hypothetical protein